VLVIAITAFLDAEEVPIGSAPRLAAPERIVVRPAILFAPLLHHETQELGGRH
jgi:hypothetical protein